MDIRSSPDPCKKHVRFRAVIVYDLRKEYLQGCPSVECPSGLPAHGMSFRIVCPWNGLQGYPPMEGPSGFSAHLNVFKIVRQCKSLQGCPPKECRSGLSAHGMSFSAALAALIRASEGGKGSTWNSSQSTYDVRVCCVQGCYKHDSAVQAV